MHRIIIRDQAGQTYTLTQTALIESGRDGVNILTRADLATAFRGKSFGVQTFCKNCVAVRELTLTVHGYLIIGCKTFAPREAKLLQHWAELGFYSLPPRWRKLLKG